MLSKITKSLKVTLIGAILFSFLPFVGYAYSPYVTTGNATAVTSNSATLNGSFNADSMTTSAWFEYGTDSSLRSSNSVTAYRFNGGASGNLVANISGLYPNTTYYFRAVAQNYEGRAYGNIYLFTTSYPYPLVGEVYAPINYSPLPFNTVTQPASSIKSTSVQLNSITYTGEVASTYTYFEWGTNFLLANRSETLLVGTLPLVKHAGVLTKLSPGTTYYFRAVAENSTGRRLGTILSFTTPGVASPAPTTETPEVESPTTPEIPKENQTNQEGSSLAASAGLSGSFLPTNVFGWVMLVILTLVLWLLVKALYRDLKSEKIENLQQGH